MKVDCQVSVVAVPKPFRGHIGIIQDNALASWSNLRITREVILIGDEEGVAEAAARARASHYPKARRDPHGTPLLDDIFRIAEEAAQADWLCYVNADIILMQEFSDAICSSISMLGPCLILSRRWNLDIRRPLLLETGWPEQLRKHASRSAELFSVYGIDVFIFPKGSFRDVPSFSLGKSSWDNWIVAEARRQKMPVVDVTDQFTVIHQNHSYSGFASMEDIRRSQQGLRNFWLAGDAHFLLGRVDDATHKLSNGQIISSGRKSVSVVVRHTTSLGQLRHCLRALTHQSYPRTFLEIIVVDNWRQAAGAAAMRLEFPFVRVTQEEKSGAAAAKNKGAAIANGEILAFIDSNCSPAADWIEKAVAALEKEDCCSIVACNIRLKKRHSGSAAVQWYEAITQSSDSGKSSAFVVPRTIWTMTGPFDETFENAPAEEWEWSMRARSSRITISYARDAVVSKPVVHTWHRLRDESRKRAQAELELAEKRSSRKPIELSSLQAALAKRLRHELRSVLRNRKASVPVRLCSGFAAVLVWYWKLRETRNKLSTTARRRRRSKSAMHPELRHNPRRFLIFSQKLARPRR